MPSASIVIPVLNAASTVGDVLNALRTQVDAPAETEIIAVDNGSTDGTQAVLRQFNVTVLEEPKRGPAAARNRGLHHARGDIVVHVDADTLPTRRWLKALVAPFDDPQTVIVGGRILSFRPETPAERYIAASGLYEPENNVHRDLFPFVVSMNMAVRRTAALAIGGWTEDMLTGEDADFCLRLQRQFGCRLAYQPEAVLFHRNRQSDAGLWRQAWSYGQGVAHMYVRHPDAVQWDVRKALHLARIIAERSAKPTLLRIAHRLGLASDEAVEFARYHRDWTWWFWRGFFRYRRCGAYRPAPLRLHSPMRRTATGEGPRGGRG